MQSRSREGCCGEFASKSLLFFLCSSKSWMCTGEYGKKVKEEGKRRMLLPSLVHPSTRLVTIWSFWGRVHAPNVKRSFVSRRSIHPSVSLFILFSWPFYSSARMADLGKLPLRSSVLAFPWQVRYHFPCESLIRYSPGHKGEKERKKVMYSLPGNTRAWESPARIISTIENPP